MIVISSNYHLSIHYTSGVQPFWLEGQVYKFETSRGPDWDAEGVQGEGNVVIV